MPSPEDMALQILGLGRVHRPAIHEGHETVPTSSTGLQLAQMLASVQLDWVVVGHVDGLGSATGAVGVDHFDVFVGVVVVSGGVRSSADCCCG